MKGSHADSAIRVALKKANLDGQLQKVSRNIGLPTDELEKIMNSTDELNIVDRGMLSLTLFGEMII